MTLFGFGKKKEKEINAPVCTCNGNCSVSETVEPENLNRKSSFKLLSFTFPIFCDRHG